MNRTGILLALMAGALLATFALRHANAGAHPAAKHTADLSIASAVDEIADLTAPYVTTVAFCDPLP